MYETIKQFYKSRAWQKCRANYIKQTKGLCERCLRKGIIKAGDEVHHKIKLTPVNINQPEISLNFNNLELLCSDCHHAEHDKRTPKRYIVDKVTGKVIPKDTPL